MRADFMETPNLLEMGESMCEALQKGNEEAHITDSELNEQLQTLRRVVYFHRGSLFLHTNKPGESLTNLREFNNMLRERFGDTVSSGKDLSLGVSWNELGNAILQNNDGKGAQECYIKSIDALAALDGATRISITMPLINLGFAYWVQGRLDEAAATFQGALEDREKEYGADDKGSFV